MSTPRATSGQRLLMVAGLVLVVAGLVTVVLGFSSFFDDALDGSGDGPGRAMARIGGGGLGAVVGLGLFGFTRAAVTRPAAGTPCPECGRPASPGARFCEGCGAARA